MNRLTRHPRQTMNWREFDLNMPEVPQAILKSLFIDETWSWEGLAEMLFGQYSRSDMEEVYRIIGERLEKK